MVAASILLGELFLQVAYKLALLPEFFPLAIKFIVELGQNLAELVLLLDYKLIQPLKLAFIIGELLVLVVDLLEEL